MSVRPSLLAALLAIGFSLTAPVQADTSIKISLKQRYLTLFENGNVIGKYPIAIGAPESPTIPGDFDIQNKDASPIYHKKGKVIAPGPDNPVDVRYMPYLRIGQDEYAIHGTAWPSWVNLRAAVSLGCIRMLNNDVIQVFNRVKVGTPVVVTTN